MQLRNGSRVVIVGGGPAGSFFALHLLRYAAQAGLELDVIIIEPRDFNRPGAGSCNKCAGILSSTLLHHLETIDLRLPADLIQSELEAYVLHIDGKELIIQQPDPARRIVSIYRGSGPRLGATPYPASFDGWLLSQAQAHGATIQRGRVMTVLPGPPPLVRTAHVDLPADLVVLATGVNSQSPLDPAWGYQPPHSETMAQDEAPLPEALDDSRVHIFFDNIAGLIFASLVPKGRYVNLSLLGHGLPNEAITGFLASPELIQLYPPERYPGGPPRLCGCRPRIAVSSARGFYADRFVAVGDAAVTRLYKDGIGSAFITAEAAARTAIQRGIGQVDFNRGYRPVCRELNTDNRFGRSMFRLWNFTRSKPFLMHAWQQAILSEEGLAPQDYLHLRILWGMFTGDESYRNIFWSAVSWPALIRFSRGILKAWKIR